MRNYGLQFPLKYTKSSSFLQYKNIKDYFRFCVKLLFLTSEKEKLNDLYYGIGLRDFLFNKRGEKDLDELRTRIRYQINRSMPMVKLENVQIIEPEENENSVYVRVFYSVPEANVYDNLDIFIPWEEK